VVNTVESSPSGAVATVCSSSVAIRSATAFCRKKAVEPDGVLRFIMSGPRLRVPDAVAVDGSMSNIGIDHNSGRRYRAVRVLADWVLIH
jgi:hypothetical protein